MASEGPITVRDATLDDAYAIAWVHVASWKVAYRGLIPDAFLASLSVERREVVWQRLLADPAEGTSTFVALAGDGVVGFADIGPSRDEGATLTTGELYSVYVEPAYWGVGAGRVLMERAIERFRSTGFASATLWVLAENARSIDFYAKAGWAADGTERTETIREIEVREVRLGRVL